MPSSVRDPVSACQAGCAQTDSRLSVLPQVSSISHDLSSQDVTMIVVVVLVLATAIVLTALWGKPARRRDALALLDRIIPWRG
jgi:hypothetical protein